MDRFIENYKRGFPFLKLVDAATVKNGGIKVMDQGEQMEASGIWESFEGRRVKFVPASGAASRMFKDLFEGLDLISKGGSLEKGSEVERFVEEIGKYPFYTPSMFDGAAPGDLLEKVVGKSGLNYGNMPKGEILFHRYKDHVRSAFEEHLVEGALYARDKDGVVRLHFTVSPDHQQGFESLFENVREMYESRFGCRYEVRFSVQDPSTDIIAVNEDNTPFLKEDGRPLYRPGGHGALLKNLNETDGEVIFLKNIDNVVHEDYIGESVKWKKILAGKLLKIRSEVFGLLNELDEESRGGNVSDELCDRIEAFLLRSSA